jgi:hypothetical protein
VYKIKLNTICFFTLVQQVLKEVINQYFSLHKFFLAFFIVFMFVNTSNVYSQNTEKSSSNNTLISNDTLSKDSTTLKKDTIPDQWGNPKISKNAIESAVKYKAQDSVRFEVTDQKVYLYNQAEVYYQDITLKANYIEIDMKKNTIFAIGTADSIGKMQGNPIFADGEQEFKAKQMLYNYKSKKGKIIDVTTKQDEGFLIGDVVKKDSMDNIYMRKGKYTTCDQEDPHFYFALNKVKVVKNDKIITGPADLFVAGIPTPLAVPFGFFPNKKGKANGIIMPRPFNSDGLGFGLEEMGYFWGINEKMDLTLSTDVYSRGSYRARATSNYVKRYKYSGNLALSFANIKTGEKGFPNYAVNRDTRINWIHNQDPKARPDSRFTANVTAGKISNIAQRNLTDYVQNNFASTITYTKQFLGTPFSLTTQASQDQNSQTKKMNINAPQIVLNMAGINPLGSRFVVGKPKFISDLRLSYSSNLKNNITTTDTGFVRDITKNLSKVMKNGLNHSVNLNTNLRVFKYFTFTPNMSYGESWYLQTIRKEVIKIEEKDTLITKNVKGFERANNLSFGTSFNTIIYGFYQIKKGPVKGFRHQLTPNASYTYSPGLGKLLYYTQNGKQNSYSIFEQSVFGAPSTKKSSVVNFGLNNNLQMKYLSKNDSINPVKKVTLLDALSISSGYNFLADSLKISPVAINARTILFNNLNVNYTANFNPYSLNSNTGNITNNLEINKTGKYGRLTNSSLNVSFTLRSKNTQNQKTDSPNATPEELEEINRNRDQYIDFNLPWSLSVSYNINYNKPQYQSTTTQNIALNGDLSLTQKWKITCSTSYDFLQKDFILPNFTVYRDLHCWDLRFNFIPYGPRKSYSIDLNVKASVLQDLKLSRKKDWYDAR